MNKQAFDAVIKLANANALFKRIGMVKLAISARTVMNTFQRASARGASPERLSRYIDTAKKWSPKAVKRHDTWMFADGHVNKVPTSWVQNDRVNPTVVRQLSDAIAKPGGKGVADAFVGPGYESALKGDTAHVRDGINTLLHEIGHGGKQFNSHSAADAGRIMYGGELAANRNAIAGLRQLRENPAISSGLPGVKEYQRWSKNQLDGYRLSFLDRVLKGPTPLYQPEKHNIGFLRRFVSEMPASLRDKTLQGSTLKLNKQAFDAVIKLAEQGLVTPTFCKVATTALVRRILAGSLSPKSVSRAAAGMPSGKFRFLNHLGTGQFTLADRVVGNVGGVTGELARKIPMRYSPNYVQEGNSLKEFTDRINTNAARRFRFGEQSGYYHQNGGPVVAPYVASTPKGVFQRLADAKPMRSKSVISFLNKRVADLNPANYGPQGQILDAAPAVVGSARGVPTNELMQQRVLPRFLTDLGGGQVGRPDSGQLNRVRRLFDDRSGTYVENFRQVIPKQVSH